MLWDMYVIAFDYERQRGVWRRAGGVLGWTATVAGETIDFARQQAKVLASIGAATCLSSFLQAREWAELGGRSFVFAGLSDPGPFVRLARRRRSGFTEIY